MLAQRIRENPNDSLPRQCANRTELAGAYRLLSNPSVDPQAIAQPHRHLTATRCNEQPVTLCVQDTTELNFSKRAARGSITGVGPLGAKDGGGQGLLQHAALAVSTTDSPWASTTCRTSFRCRQVGRLHQTLRRMREAAGVKIQKTYRPPHPARHRRPAIAQTQPLIDRADVALRCVMVVTAGDADAPIARQQRARAPAFVVCRPALLIGRRGKKTPHRRPLASAKLSNKFAAARPP